jgi:hypothetical protein
LWSEWLAVEPGSSEDVFARVRIGMSQEETIAVLRSYDPDKIEAPFVEGITKDGRAFAGTDILAGGWFLNLPPPEEVAYCALGVWDTDDRKVEVILGPGGIVARKKLSPDAWEYRLEKVCDTLSRTRSDLASGSWWNQQPRKIYRSVRRKSYWIAASLAVVLVLASVWRLRCKSAGPEMPHTQPTEPRRA